MTETLVDKDYPEAVKVTVIQDNLNTHSPASLYKAFEPAEAQRILNHLEFCHTPNHGSWLNMAEIELSVLSRQCLDRRLPDFETLTTEVEAWMEHRNQEKTWIDWRFTTADARVKLQRLYPSINNWLTTRAVVFVNQAVKGTKLKDEAIEVLRLFSGVTVLNKVIHQRQIVADCFGQNSTVFDLSGSSAGIARREMEELFKQALEGVNG